MTFRFFVSLVIPIPIKDKVTLRTDPWGTLFFIFMEFDRVCHLFSLGWICWFSIKASYRAIDFGFNKRFNNV